MPKVTAGGLFGEGAPAEPTTNNSSDLFGTNKLKVGPGSLFGGEGLDEDEAAQGNPFANPNHRFSIGGALSHTSPNQASRAEPVSAKPRPWSLSRGHVRKPDPTRRTTLTGRAPTHPRRVERTRRTRGSGGRDSKKQGPSREHRPQRSGKSQTRSPDHNRRSSNQVMTPLGVITRVKNS
jgi:hypothetical protein